ncbi:glycosyltransferase family 4 protein [Symbioplanes lichenis]|uniref:glycosyltransferase family 4 protein n=1 Tax=Symbioplanes lichenis TaxID=1629072 RepID=UPI0027399485|nr:glycosyltransferase family 4 protein [Actinoplanes lichenis]
MRVLLVSDMYPPFPGGLEAHVARLARHLITRGHEVAVVSVRHPTSDISPAIASPLLLDLVPGLYRAGRPFHPPWPDPLFRRTLRRTVDAFRPDVVHAHGWCVFSAVAAARDVPVVTTLHDYGLLCPAKSLSCGGRRCTGRLCCATCAGCEQGMVRRVALAGALRLRTPALVRRLAAMIAVSSCVAETHLAAGVGDPDRMHVVPNFVDLPPARPEPVPASGRVLFVGPPDRHKGRSVLEQAFTRDCLRDRELRLVGDAAARSAGNVVAVGRRSGADLWREFHESSVVALPGVWMDPCPTVALEAMALGRPVVGSGLGGLTDIVEDGVTGVLVPPGDPDRLARALAGLTADPGRLAGYGTAGLARVRSRFSPDAVVPRIEAIYREVAT